jgi:NADH-quinone oxidoreductase subunit M
MLRSFQQTMLGESNVRTKNFIDIGLNEKIVLYPIVALIILIGIYPAPLLRISEAAVENLWAVISNYHAVNQ